MPQQQNVQQGVQEDMLTAKQMDDFVTIDLMDLVNRLIAKWKMIVCVVLIFMLVSAVYTICFVTPLYRATSVIYVLSNSDSVVNVADLQIGNALKHDYIKLFQIWELHDAVISELNLPYSIGQMRRMLSVTNASDTRMLDITITATSAKEAALIANAYAEIASEFISETMSTDKPNIVSTALPPTGPSSPNLTRNIVMAGALGALLICVYVVIGFLADDKFKSSDDIRKYTGWTTLATVPIDQNDSKKNLRR